MKVATKRHLHQWVKEQGYYECHATHRNVSLRVFPVVWIFRESLGVVCYDRWVLSENHKNYFKDWCLTNSKLTFLILTSSQVIEMAILSKRHILDTSGPRKSLKLNFTNIWVFRSNLAEWKSFLESKFLDILGLCKTNMDDSINSGNFSERCYLPLIRKVSVTHMYGIAVCVKEGLPFARGLSLEISTRLYLYFWFALLHSVPYFFFLYRSASLSLCTAISSNMDEFLSISPFANCICLWRLQHPS